MKQNISDVTATVGGTPLVRLDRRPGTAGHCAAKLEIQESCWNALRTALDWP